MHAQLAADDRYHADGGADDVLLQKDHPAVRQILHPAAARPWQGERLYRRDDGGPEGRQGVHPRTEGSGRLPRAERPAEGQRQQSQQLCQHHDARQRSAGQYQLRHLRSGGCSHGCRRCRQHDLGHLNM